MIRLEDELIAGWLQTYPNLKQRLVQILFRRYKNLIYKEIAKQCDQRYDREEIIQQIVFLFVQLLEEYDKKRGIPLAGFLKIKLPNRIYNYFKSQLKMWDAEIPHDGLVSSINTNREDETEIFTDTYEINYTTTEQQDFWIGLAQILSYSAFEALFLKFDCEYGTDEISILMRLRGPCDVEKILNTVLDDLRYDNRVFVGITFDPSEKLGGTQKPFKKETVDMGTHLFQALHQEVCDFCGIFAHGGKTLQQIHTMNNLYTKGQNIHYKKLDELFFYIIQECGCLINRPPLHGERNIC